MSNFWEGDPVVAPAKGGGNFWDSDPVVAAPDPVTVNKVVRSAATGVLGGGLLNKLDAATNATLAPVVEPFLAPSKEDISRHGETWAQRYSKSKAMQDAADAKMAEEHPVVDTAAKIAGGVGSAIPIMKAAPAAFGLTGTLPQMVVRGAASNAVLGGADAVTRGENPTVPAVVGGVVGGVAPLAARAVGTAARAIQDYRNPPPLVPQNVVKVAGADIPMSEGRLAGDLEKQTKEELARRGAAGTEAQRIAQASDELAQKGADQAATNISSSMDPSGTIAQTPAKDAAGSIQTELTVAQRAQEAADAARAAQVGAQGDSLAQGLAGGAAPASPLDAAEGVGSAIGDKRDAAVNATKAAYQARDAVPGAFDPSVPKGLAEDIRGRLNTGENPLWVDPTNESTANRALKLIDQTLGKDSGLFANSAAPKPVAEPAPTAPARPAEDEITAGLRAKYGDTVADAYAKQNGKAASGGNAPLQSITGPKASAEATVTAPARPIDLRTMDEARKQLGTMFGDAKSAALRSGDRSDMRAMGKILEEFDNSIRDALQSGKFSGDAATALRLQEAARKSHAEYRQTFSSRGPGDEIGRNIEKILGRYTDTASSPEEIQRMAYGPASAPGGGPQSRLSERMQKIFGPNSPEYGQYKAGLFKHVLGDDSLSPAEKAARIDKFLPGSLAKTALQPAERRAMAAHSASLKSIQPGAKPTDRVGKALARITGADGNPPATIDEVTKMLFSRGARGDGLSVELGEYLKRNLSAPSLAKLKQGAFEHLITKPEGQPDLTSGAMAKRLSEYLDGDLSKVLNTPAELAEMRNLMLAHRMMTPVAGSTQPSGTAFFGQKMMRSAGRNLMAMMGFAHGGVSGLAVGHGLDAVAGMVKEARSAKEAAQLFFGKQPKAPVHTSRIPQLLAPAISQRAQGGAQ